MSPSPLALQLAVRVEKLAPPRTADACRVSALATIALLTDRRSQPGGEWHSEVEAWNGARIRKIVRRGRGNAWHRAQEPRGVTIHVDGVSVRAYVPGPMDEVPASLAKLQIQSRALDEPVLTTQQPQGHGLLVAISPEVTMSWGKQAAQCAHAVQRAWMTSPPERRSAWHRAGRPIHVLHPSVQLWPSLVTRAETHIHDGGYTEIPAGTLSTVAWWNKPFWSEGAQVTREEIRLGGPSEERIGLSRAVRAGNHISVGGTAAINSDGTNVSGDDIEGQVRRIWQIIEDALVAAGASLTDVVRTRTMLVDVADFEIASRIRREVLSPAMPADTIVEVSRFVDPEWRIEIEADAVVTSMPTHHED